MLPACWTPSPEAGVCFPQGDGDTPSRRPADTGDVGASSRCTAQEEAGAERKLKHAASLCLELVYAMLWA